MMPLGKYYIGDLCYVLSDEEWEQVCRITIVGNKCIEGEFNLPDGRRFAMYNTAYGDGLYKDGNDREYSVDSGTIGCILLDDIKADKYDESLDRLGSVYDFYANFVTSNDKGVIQFGRVMIDTDPAYEEEDY